MLHDVTGLLDLYTISLHALARNKKLIMLLAVAMTTGFMFHVHVSLSLFPCRDYPEELPRVESVVSEVAVNTSVARRKVIILSYMRSGSTLCGDILQAHPDVFYVYEPLLYLWDYRIPYKDVKGLSVRKRTKHYWRKCKSYLPEALDFLDYMFRCNLTTYNLEFLTNVIHSQDFTAADCFSTWKHVNMVVNLTQSCVDRVLQRCLDSKTIVQKVVRLTMAEADVYLQRDPAVRIIHLVRDPRGILLSRMHFNKKTGGEMHKNYTSICLRIWDDLRVSKEISARHWGRILTIRYEDLAQDPLALTTILYRFVGLDLLQEVKSYVRTITSSEMFRNNGKITAPEVARYPFPQPRDHDNTGAKKTSRKYPFRTAYHWRLELPFSLVKDVDLVCRKVLNTMGYVSYPTEEQLRDMNTPAKLTAYGDGLLTVASLL